MHAGPVACWLVGVDPRRRQEKVNSWQASLFGGPTAVGAATTVQSIERSYLVS
jgi:hypothetical protein